MTFRFLSFLLVALILWNCASQTSPQGGPKDEEPPKLVETNPANNSVNFKGRTVELTFSEGVKLNNPKEEVIIIPPVGKRTEFIAKRNKVIIAPEKDWAANTTYTINFREAVQDITEGNKVPDLKLAFSTGTYIDSLQISGKVIDALKETIPEKITVAIFSADTFNIFEHTPDYFTQTDKEGNYKISNLKAGTYRIYAFEDKNKNRKVESKTEKFGFRPTTLELTKNVKDVNLRVTNIDSRELKFNNVRNQADLNTVRLNKPVQQYKVSGNTSLQTTFGSDQSEILVYYPSTITHDSTNIKLTAIDSIGQKIDTTIYIKKDAKERIKSTFTYGFTNTRLNTDTKEFFTEFSYSKLFTSINLDSIYLTIDSTTHVFFKPSDITIDTIRRKMVLKNLLDIKKESKPTLKTGKGWMITIDNDSTKAEEKKIPTLNSESTATLLVEVQTKEPNYIIQILDSKYQVLDSQANQPKATFKYLEPTNIKVRVILDTNKNGKWDPHNYLTNEEAERIIYYLNSDKKYETPLRANWEVGPLIIKF